jgi:hypothetical protein
MITITGTLSKAWMHRALGVVFDRDYYFDPARRHAIDCRCNEHADTMFPGMRVFYSESNLGRLDYWDKDQVLIGGIQPNMILGMLLGADFVPAADRDADITPRCLEGRDPAALPAPEVLLDHELIRLFDEQIRDQPKRGLRAIPPFFWDSSGRAAIHGVLTTAQKLCGETIFMDLLTEPARCRQLLDWIADAYIVLCRHFAEAAELSITDVHVGECSGCMIGPDLMEELIAPVTSKIGTALGPVRFHSCGTSTHLLPVLAHLDGLHTLDVGSGTSIGKAREVFGREMPITIAPSPQDMSAENAGPILHWAAGVVAENAGGNLGFVYHLEPSYNAKTIHALTDFVRHQPDFRKAGGFSDG